MNVFTYILKFGLAKLASFASSVLSSLLSVLPDCPFEDFIKFSDDMKIIGFLNYFIAFDNLIVILQSWLSFVMVYFAYRIISGTLYNVPIVGGIIRSVFYK